MSKLLIIIPGLMASELSRGSGGPIHRNRPVWLDPANLAATGPLGMALDADGEGPKWPSVRLFHGKAVIGLTNVDSLRAAGLSSGFVPKLVNYDWRGRLQTSAEQVLIGIAEAIALADDAVTEIATVCHSMGGLVARIAYANAPENIKAVWKKTIRIGTPHGGAYDAARTLNGEGSFWNVHFDNWIKNFVAQNFVSNYKSVLLTMVRSWPSIWALLPRSDDKWSELDPHLAWMADRTKWQSPDEYVDRGIAWFDEQRLALNSSLQSQPETSWDLVGSGRLTIEQYHPLDGSTGFTGHVVRSDWLGDGIVQSNRAVLGANFATFGNVVHASMISNNNIAGTVLRILRETPPAAAELIREPPYLIAPLDIPPRLDQTIPALIAPFYPADRIHGASTYGRRGDP